LKKIREVGHFMERQFLVSKGLKNLSLTIQLYFVQSIVKAKSLKTRQSW